MTKDELIALRRERGKQELNIGDRVKVYDQDGEALYSGKAFEIIGKSKYNSGFIYSLHGLMSPFTAELLELVKEPTDEIKVGDRVETSCGVFIVDMIAGVNIFGHYENGDAGIWTKKELNKHKSTDNNANTITIPVEADFGDTYWDAYRAELVKGIVISVANEETITSPTAADCITDFATRIVDNLKKKKYDIPSNRSV